MTWGYKILLLTGNLFPSTTVIAGSGARATKLSNKVRRKLLGSKGV
jgi:hypothetical protein